MPRRSNRLYQLLRSVLFLLPAETAHRVGMAGLRLLSVCTPLCRWLYRRAQLPDLAVDVAGLRFPSPIGLAAGLDKDAEAVAGLFATGFGFVEVGTVTPRPQPGNPRPRLFRLPAYRALVNRMGFNNRGAAAAARRLERCRFRPGPIGVNLGKNKDTPLESADADYLACVDAVAAVAAYLVVNASSPNTPGLRALQEPERLTALLEAVRARSPKPLFLKIAPDLTPEAIDAAVDVAIACRLQGVICTNTTVARPVSGQHAEQAGGLSGAPLADMSTAVVRQVYRRAAGRLAVMGVGGVFSADDAYAKIRAGAALVQIYTGFIYEGPGLPVRLARDLSVRLARDGLTLTEAVGRDA